MRRALWRRFLQRGSIPTLSLFVAVVLITQSTVSLVLFQILQGVHRTWPFLDYPMYALSHHEGERVSKLVVIGAELDGGEHEVTSEDLGLGDWAFSMFVRALLRDEQAAIQEFVRAYEQKQAKQLLWPATTRSASSSRRRGPSA